MSESARAAAPPAPDQPLDFSTATDADLFEWMALGESSLAEAHAAFAEFHRRHAAFLYARCERRYGGEAEDILAEDLRRVYATAGRFDRSTLSDETDHTAARRLVRAWVGRIIRWAAANHFAQLQRQPESVTQACITSLPDERCASPTTSPLDSALIAHVRTVIDSLPPRDQEIAWTLAHGWSPEAGRLRWSQADLDAIGERFGLTRENIRQIRHRLIRRLRTLLEPLMDGSHSDR